MLVLSGTEGEVTGLAFSPAGHLLAAGSGSRVDLWELPSGRHRRVREGRLDLGAGAPAFHPTEPVCFVWCPEGVSVVDTGTGKARALPHTTYPFLRLGATAPTPDGEGFVGFADTADGGVLTLLRRQPGNTLRVEWSAVVVGPRAWNGRPVAVRVFPDGRSFVTVEANLRRVPWAWLPVRVVRRSTADGAVLARGKLPPSSHPVVAVSPDGRHLVTTRTNVLTVWDAEHLGRGLREVGGDTRKHFTAVAFHPSGRYLAAASNDATVKLYDTATWRLARAYTWDVGKMRSVAFSPDGSLAAAGADTGRIVVWDVDV